MDLQEFITETISQIMRGVKESHTAAIEAGGKVNSEKNYGRTITTIEFDVAITTTNETEKGGGGRISVFGASIGGEGKTGTENSICNRIKFNVPVLLPTQKV